MTVRSRRSQSCQAWHAYVGIRATRSGKVHTHTRLTKRQRHTHRIDERVQRCTTLSHARAGAHSPARTGVLTRPIRRPTAGPPGIAATGRGIGAHLRGTCVYIRGNVCLYFCGRGTGAHHWFVYVTIQSARTPWKQTGLWPRTLFEWHLLRTGTSDPGRREHPCLLGGLWSQMVHRKSPELKGAHTLITYDSISHVCTASLV